MAVSNDSLLALERDRLVVGPDSVGAQPGLIIYCCLGGLLAITYANVVCGRVFPAHFLDFFGKRENKPLDAAALIRDMEEPRL